MLYFGLLLALGQVASALNLTYSGNCTSSNSSSIDIPFINATSTTNFTLKELTGNDDPWYYHLALVSPAHKDPMHQMIHSWLSIPESFLGTETANQTTLCAHFLDSQEASVKNMQGNNTCAGILSDKCIQVFENTAGPSSSEMCPSPSLDALDECKSSSGFSSGTSSLPKNLCRITNLPVDVPEGYATIGLVGTGYGNPYDDDDSTRVKDYDEAVKKTAPVIFRISNSSSNREQTRTSTLTLPVCPIPYHALEGSRPVGSRGRQLQIASSAVLVVAVSLLYNVVS